MALRKLLVEVFQTVDKNNSGSIELDEFLMFYTNMKKVVPQLKGKNSFFYDSIRTQKIFYLYRKLISKTKDIPFLSCQPPSNGEKIIKNGKKKTNSCYKIWLE